MRRRPRGLPRRRRSTTQANGFDPHEMLRDFDEGKTQPAGERPRRCASGRSSPHDKEIEVAPGMTFPAWTYNGRIPGPTLRAREGERLRITFVNGSAAPAHDPLPRHPPGRDGRRARPRRRPDRARRAHGLRVRRAARSACTSTTATSARWPSTSPRASTARSSSTRRSGREEADEMVMVMNGFDTNFDRANELYAANTIGFAYMDAADRRQARRARAGLPGQRPRVRPASTRSTCTATSSTTSRPGRR